MKEQQKKINPVPTFDELVQINKKRKFYQIAFLVEDLEGTMKNWVELLHIGPWLIIEMNQNNCTDVIEQGKKSHAPFQFFCATAMVGEMQIELIKPVFGVEAYDRWMKLHGPGPHHIKECVPDGLID
ncbi:MAG: VOC family protein, partial [Victivallaceae bacterium]|nr:VOC family protein [Victivallaceae bacterium]